MNRSRENPSVIGSPLTNKKDEEIDGLPFGQLPITIHRCVWAITTMLLSENWLKCSMVLAYGFMVLSYQGIVQLDRNGTEKKKLLYSGDNDMGFLVIEEPSESFCDLLVINECFGEIELR
ncbi:hypothetical protein DINM_006331 [Dirofilaria immitis]|nr:hypothetical protein [Dirofilaria immitis]